MRKAILFLASLLAPVCHAQLVIGGAPTQPSVLTCWALNDQAASSTTVSVSVTPVGGSGHALIAFVRAGSGNPFSFSDNSSSNTWNNISVNNTGTAGSWGLAYVQNPNSGSYTVTGTLSGSSPFRSITVCEASGVQTSSSLDTTTTTASTCASTTSCTTSTFSTGNAHELIVVFATVNSTTDTFSSGTIGGATAALLPSPVANDSTGQSLFVTTIQSTVTAVLNAGTAAAWGYVVAGFKTP